MRGRYIEGKEPLQNRETVSCSSLETRPEDPHASGPCQAVALKNSSDSKGFSASTWRRPTCDGLWSSCICCPAHQTPATPAFLPRFNPNKSKAVNLRSAGGGVCARSTLAPHIDPLGPALIKVGNDLAKKPSDWKDLRMMGRLTIQNRQIRLRWSFPPRIDHQSPPGTTPGEKGAEHEAQ